MISRLLTSALALAVLVGAAECRAQPVDATENNQPVVRETIHFADLDTSTPAGAERLAFRIRTVANEVCMGGDPNVRAGVGLEECMRATIAAVEAKLQQPMVTAALGHHAGMTLARR